jgi:hypothetical protein
MKRTGIGLHILLNITFPLMIIILSLNIVLRVPETYTYYYNDSQVTSSLGTNTSGSEFAEEITGYFNSFSKSEFQVYEKNGEYLDPVFDQDEQVVMKKAKHILSTSMYGGIFCALISFSSYFYLYKKGRKDILRTGGKIACILAELLSIAVFIVMQLKGPMNYLFKRLIGVYPAKESLLRILMGSPFEKTASIFFIFLATILVAIFLYFHLKRTKAPRIFSK